VSSKIINFIIVTYNSEKYIKKCIDSILNINSNNDFGIIVVDNNSKDNTIPILESYENKIILIKSDENLGFGKANNLGCKNNPADYYFIFNVDAYIEGDFCLDETIDILDMNPEYAIVGTRLQYPDKNSQTSSFSYSSALKWLLLLLRLNELLHSDLTKNILTSRFFRFILSKSNLVDSYVNNHTNIKFDYSIENVDWVSGASMLVADTYFQEFGLFDENIFLYGEDEDACIMAKKNGFLVGLINTNPITHVHGWGTQNKFNKIVADMKFNSLLYFIDKHFSNKTSHRMLLKLLLPFHVYGIIGGFYALFTKKDFK
jgi:N-acetylglucosaminyl-diphospho-decaprenol L-rhamnosyltransferase